MLAGRCIEPQQDWRGGHYNIAPFAPADLGQQGVSSSDWPDGFLPAARARLSFFDDAGWPGRSQRSAHDPAWLFGDQAVARQVFGQQRIGLVMAASQVACFAGHGSDIPGHGDSFSVRSCCFHSRRS